MSSSYYAGAPRDAGGASWRSRRDGDQAPASFPHDDITAVACKATTVAVRSDHDKHSVPVSPPSSGIDRERGDEDHRSLAAGKQAAMSGNIEQPGGRVNGSSSDAPSGTRSDGDDESQAVSAVALLLLAASATSQAKLPVTFGVAGGGKSVREQAFPACADGCREITYEEIISYFFLPLSHSLSIHVQKC